MREAPSAAGHAGAIFAIAAGVLFACSAPSDIAVQGCPGCKTHPDAGPELRPDAGAGDAGADAGPGPDAGADAGPQDAGPDAGSADAGGVDGGPLTGEVCPAGSIPFPGQTFDLCQRFTLGVNVPLDGVQVATLDPYSATISADGGYYVACLPPGQPTTLKFTAPNYVTGYMAEVDLTMPILVKSNIGAAEMLCSSALQNFGTQVPLFDPALGTVYGLVLSATQQQPCGGVDGGLAGWIFTAAVGDGGTPDAGQAAYFDSSGNLEAVSASLDQGRALLFNIDPSAQYVVVTADKPTAGGLCGSLDTVVGMTGRVYVEPNSFGFFPWIVP